MIAFILIGLVFFVSACKNEPTTDDDFQIIMTAQFLNGLEGGLKTSGKFDEIDWTSHLSVLDFKAYLATQYTATGLFTLVTSIDGKTMTNVIGDLKTTGYISIPIHIRSNQPDVILIEEIRLNGLHKNHNLDVGFHNPKGNFMIHGDSFQVNIADAVRISLIGMIDANEHIIVYENPESLTNVVLGGHQRSDFSKNLLGAHDYYFRKTGSLLPQSDAVSVIDTVTEIDLVPIWMFNPQSSPSSDGKYYGVLYLLIWIEVWDYNAFMFIANDYLTVSLAFTIYTAENNSIDG